MTTRVHVIEEIQFAIPKTKVDSSGLIDEFKQKNTLKINQEIEPLLNTLFSSSWRDEDKLILYNDISHNVTIYVYMNKEVLSKIINKINNPIVKQLKQLITDVKDATSLSTLPAGLKPTSDDKKKTMTKNLKEIVFQRYQSQLLRYIDYLLIVFKL